MSWGSGQRSPAVVDEYARSAMNEGHQREIDRLKRSWPGRLARRPAAAPGLDRGVRCGPRSRAGQSKPLRGESCQNEHRDRPLSSFYPRWPPRAARPQRRSESLRTMCHAPRSSAGLRGAGGRTSPRAAGGGGRVDPCAARPRRSRGRAEGSCVSADGRRRSWPRPCWPPPPMPPPRSTPAASRTAWSRPRTSPPPGTSA